MNIKYLSINVNVFFIKLIIIFLNILLVASRYDQRGCLFSPDGRLLQAEYANQAAEKGNLITCILSENDEFIVITPTRKKDQFLQGVNIDKIATLDDDTWMIFSGLAGDGRMVIEAARRYCINYKNEFGNGPSLAGISYAVGGMQHRATLSADGRPFGINTAIFGFDKNGNSIPKIYVSKATGHVTRWKAFALGRNSKKAIISMEEELHQTPTVKEAIVKLLKIMKKVATMKGGSGDEGNGESGELEVDKFDVFIIKKNINNKNYNNDNNDGSSSMVISSENEILYASGVSKLDDLPKEWKIQ